VESMGKKKGKWRKSPSGLYNENHGERAILGKRIGQSTFARPRSIRGNTYSGELEKDTAGVGY